MESRWHTNTKQVFFPFASLTELCLRGFSREESFRILFKCSSNRDEISLNSDGSFHLPAADPQQRSWY